MDNRTIMILSEKINPHRLSIKSHLTDQEYKIVEVCDHVVCIHLLEAKKIDIIIIATTNEKTWSSLKLAERIRKRDRLIPLIIITCQSSEALAIAALKLGTNDYFTCPINFQGLHNSIKKILTNIHSSSVSASKPLKMQPSVQVLVGDSPEMQSVRRLITKIARSDNNVLITGETGTGKECVAKLIHDHSPRCKKPLVCLNCAALPDSLLESELFGYERGAFTGANTAYPGKLKIADGGSVFFDEIGDMSLFSQAKILRVLENKEITPLCSKIQTVVDIRIIAATNHNLEQLVVEKKFREDLYYRINVTPIRLPPLRERKEDIPLLIEHFLRMFKVHSKPNIEGFTEKALQCLLQYHWPGNIRELKNILESLSILNASQYIKPQDLPATFDQFLIPDDRSLDEKDLLLSTLLSTNWNKSKTAEKLNWSRMTVYRKIEKYHIVPNRRTKETLITH